MVPNRHGSSTAYSYGFGGHEKDDEIKGDGNHYDFGNYGLDVRIGRRFQNDPITNPSVSSYAVFNNNPLHYTDPTGMSPSDWIRDKKTGKYSWDSKVNNKSQTPAGSEYVGSSINDVFSDFTKQSPFKAFFGGVPDFGDISTWEGEINTPQDHSSFGFNWTYLRNRGKFVDKMIFEVGNSINIFAQMAMGRQVGLDMRNLDGTPTEQPQGIFALYMALPFGGELKAFEPSIAENSASKIASSWQGKGLYPGVDKWADGFITEGEFLISGYPGKSNFFTTAEGLQSSGFSQKSFFEGLQVKPHDVFGYRPKIAIYRVESTSEAAFSTVKANPQFGSGGLPQIFVPKPENLKLIKTVPLNH